MESVNRRQNVAILGGGQLARMLAESALRLGLRPIPLASSASDPAAQLCPDAVFGSWDDAVVLRRLFAQAPVAAFENEFVPCETLEKAAAGLEVRFLPELGTLFRLQNKLRQKEILARLHIPSSPYEALSRGEDSRAWSRRMLRERFAGGCVFKWAQLGYDGKGTWISSGNTDDEAEAAKFCEDAVRRHVPIYAEAKVAFKRELAVVASHSTHGEFVAWPLVISRQSGGICRLVTGPATSLGVAKELEAQAQHFARQLAEALPIHGTFAIELFETAQGELLVNELAPRVHNSGHYTQDASATSQFENHWRALLGLPLGQTVSAPGFAMLNLLGPEGVEGEESILPVPSSRAHLHWYGKAELRPGRKLGHLNGSVDSAAEVPGLVRELEVCESDWIQRITRERKAK